MPKDKKSTIKVQGIAITIISHKEDDFISLTDMVKNFDGGSALIEQWLKNKDTVMFLGIWEQINNPDFNSIEFEGINNEAGRNSFYLSAKKWLKATNAKGFSERNIKFMVQFYKEYWLDAAIGKQPVSQFEKLHLQQFGAHATVLPALSNKSDAVSQIELVSLCRTTAGLQIKMRGGIDERFTVN
jgi:hypothetical protein